MSVQAPPGFNFGFHRRLMASVNLTPAGSLTATIHCRTRHCFSTTQRIERIAP